MKEGKNGWKGSFDVRRRSYANVVISFDKDLEDGKIDWEFVVNNSEKKLITTVGSEKKKVRLLKKGRAEFLI